MVMLRNSPERYGIISQTLHWIIVVFVSIQFVVGSIAADLPLGMQRLILLSRHKSIGMTIFILMILRLLWRLSNQVPLLPAGMSSHEQRLARLIHWLFYILLLCIPVAGWINSSASNLTVSWFGIFNWPDLVEPDKYIATIAKGTHKILVWTLLAIISLHTMAALRHHFILKNNILIRMIPGFKGKTGKETIL